MFWKKPGLLSLGSSVVTILAIVYQFCQQSRSKKRQDLEDNTIQLPSVGNEEKERYKKGCDSRNANPKTSKSASRMPSD